MKICVVTPNKNHLHKTLLIMGHNIPFKEVMWKFIPKLSLYPFLSGALISREDKTVENIVKSFFLTLLHSERPKLYVYNFGHNFGLSECNRVKDHTC